MADAMKTVGPLVSAAHLADGAMPALSELEFALTVMSNAFQRWTMRCMAAAGTEGLQPIDILVLHAANHRGREKSIADICLMFNVEDTHLVAYAVKKLTAAGLIAAGRRGKEKTAHATAAGAAACARYREVREALLVESVLAMGVSAAETSKIASFLHALSGQYDQAARGAISL